MYLSIFAAPCPKRFETIFTSSGCETSLGIFRCPSCIRAAFICGQDLRYVLRRQVVVEVVIDLDCRCPAAGADAFNFFEREDAVRSYTFVPDAELFLEFFVDIVSAAEHAA